VQTRMFDGEQSEQVIEHPLQVPLITVNPFAHSKHDPVLLQLRQFLGQF
jgi:hypothetical protein